MTNQENQTNKQDSPTKQEPAKVHEPDVSLSSDSNKNLSGQDDPGKVHEPVVGLSTDSDKNLFKQHDLGKVNESDTGSSLNLEKLERGDPLIAEKAQHKESEFIKKRKMEGEQFEQAKNARLRISESKEIIYRCLLESFSGFDDIQYNFYLKYFEDFSKELATDKYSNSIWQLIQFCGKLRITNDLWSFIKKERLEQYKIYHPKWEQAVAENQQSQEDSENSRSVNSIDKFKPSSVTREKQLAPGGQAHPLSENNRAAINDWFYNELGCQEKSMVLSVALFEGINRRLLGPISQEIERRIFEKT